MRTFLVVASLAGLVCAVPARVDSSPADPKDGITLKDLPVWGDTDYKADSATAAAIKLQAMGKGKARETLLDLADIDKPTKRHEARLKADGLTGDRLEIAVAREAIKELRQRQGIFILCGMLFTAKTGGKFWGPGLGVPVFVGTEWYRTIRPRVPIEVVDGVPFLVVMGYNLGGSPELPESYVSYCLKECDWNPVVYKPRSADEKRRALEKLVGYLKAQTHLGKYGEAFLSAQIK